MRPKFFFKSSEIGGGLFATVFADKKGIRQISLGRNYDDKNFADRIFADRKISRKNSTDELKLHGEKFHDRNFADLKTLRKISGDKPLLDSEMSGEILTDELQLDNEIPGEILTDIDFAFRRITGFFSTSGVSYRWSEEKTPGGLPLVLPKASRFCLKVWEEASKIPCGKTVTYGGLARRVGGKKFARAAARALSANAFPILIPCHRVVAKSGLGGYSEGVEVKRILLKMEAEN